MLKGKPADWIILVPDFLTPPRLECTNNRGWVKGTDTTFLGFFLITAQELPHSPQEWSEVTYIIKDKSSNQFIVQETGKE